MTTTSEPAHHGDKYKQEEMAFSLVSSDSADASLRPGTGHGVVGEKANGFRSQSGLESLITPPERSRLCQR